MEPPKKTLPYDYSFKLLLLGNTAVGKTSILQRFLDDTFDYEHKTTLAIDFRIKTISLMDKKIQLQIWDTSGQERFRAVATSYYRGAMGILMIYDITNKESFDRISEWLDYVKAHSPSDVVKVLIGNKCDLFSRRVVSEEKGKELADSLGMSFFETSSKTRANIYEVFEFLAVTILKKQSSQVAGKAICTNNTDTVKLKDTAVSIPKSTCHC